jgi:3',5'-cyclic AMP phosphodiesterase CpdA
LRAIAHLSDLHFGRHDPRLAEALLASLSEQAANLVVVTGDLTQRARTREFQAARSFLDRISPPKLIIPGNHDVPLYNVIARLWRPYAKFERHIALAADKSPFFVVDSEIAVLGINTARRLTGKNGRVSYAQMHQIKTVLGGQTNGVFRVLATHHPLAIPSSGDPIELVGRSRGALGAIASAGVHLLLSGHYHRSVSGEVAAELAANRTVLVVHAGTAISVRRRGGDPNAYNLIRLDKERLSIAVLDAEGAGRFRQSRIANYVLEEGIWRQRS